MTTSTRPSSKPNRAGTLHRERLEALALRRRIEAAAEALIALLDQLDAPAEDLEPEADREPWLAAPEGHPCQLLWSRGCDDDREHDSQPEARPDLWEGEP